MHRLRILGSVLLLVTLVVSCMAMAMGASAEADGEYPCVYTGYASACRDGDPSSGGQHSAGGHHHRPLDAG